MAANTELPVPIPIIDKTYLIWYSNFDSIFFNNRKRFSKKLRQNGCNRNKGMNAKKYEQNGRLGSDNQKIRTQSSLQIKFELAFDLTLSWISSPQIYPYFLVLVDISYTSSIFQSRKCSNQHDWKNSAYTLGMLIAFWSCWGLKGMELKGRSFTSTLYRYSSGKFVTEIPQKCYLDYRKHPCSPGPAARTATFYKITSMRWWRLNFWSSST